MAPLTLNLSKIPYPNVKGMIEVGNSLGDYTLKNARSAVISATMATFDAKACTIVNINNGKRNYLAHLAPELETPQSVEKGLEKTLLKMEDDASEDIKAMIVGGWDSSNPKSFDLSIKIADLFDKFGIDFSMICGKPKGAPAENMIVARNLIKVWSDKFKELFAKLDVKKATKEDVQQALENHYEVVELSDNIPVKIIDSFAYKTQALVNDKKKSAL